MSFKHSDTILPKASMSEAYTLAFPFVLFPQLHLSLKLLPFQGCALLCMSGIGWFSYRVGGWDSFAYNSNLRHCLHVVSPSGHVK